MKPIGLWLIIRCVSVVAEACVIGNVPACAVIDSGNVQRTRVASLWCTFTDNIKPSS